MQLVQFDSILILKGEMYLVILTRVPIGQNATQWTIFLCFLEMKIIIPIPIRASAKAGQKLCHPDKPKSLNMMAEAITKTRKLHFHAHLFFIGSLSLLFNLTIVLFLDAARLSQAPR